MIAKTTTRETSSLKRDAARETLLLGDLLTLLDNPGGPDVCQWLVVILDELLCLLTREFRSEEAEGYLNVVLEEYPSWDRQVNELCEQHDRIFRRLQELRNEAVQLGPHSRISFHFRLQVFDWVGFLTEHNRQESEMLQIAVNLEVGVGD